MPASAGGAVAAQRPDTRHRLERLHAQAVAIVEREYATGIEMDEIARELATSRRQLQRAFAEVGRTTFRAHVARVRAFHAARLLADPSLSLGTVSRLVGYSQQAHFTTAFRQHHGMLPSHYRRTVALPRAAARRAAAAGPGPGPALGRAPGAAALRG